MTPSEVARVLTKCAAYDQRTIGQGDVLAWHEILEPVDLVDALDAVRRHYRNESRRAMPADVRLLAMDAKRDRLRREHAARDDQVALPSRWEPRAGGQARPAFERTAQIRAEARARIAEAQLKAAEARGGFASAEAALEALNRALETEISSDDH